MLGILPEFRGGVHIFLPAPHTIGSVPSLSGHAVAYRWRSLPRVRWHRASSPQGSSSNGCCPCITMDQMLLCSSLFPHPLLIYSENVQIIGCTKYTSIKILVLLLQSTAVSPSQLLSVHVCKGLEFRVGYEAFYGNDHGTRKHIHHWRNWECQSLLTLHRDLGWQPLECRPFKYRQYNKRQSGENVPGFSFHVCCMLCVVCVFFPFILDIKFVGRTSRGHTGGRSHRISHPPSFCGACLNFSREKESAIPFPHRPWSHGKQYLN